MGSHLEQFRKTSAVIHLENLAHNVRELRSALGSSVFFCPMVKANAYGHGDVEIALRLEAEGVTVMGVGLIEEGILLRQMGVKTELLFFGLFDSKGAGAVIQHRLTPVLSTWDQVHALSAVAPADFPVHLKFDTGMHRLGFSISEISKLVSFFQNAKLKVAGILTHLHSGENAGDLQASSFQQLEIFQQVEKAFAPWQPVSHTLNSAGSLHFTAHRGKTLPHGISPEQGVRPGLAIYGITPVATNLKLKPVMSLRSEAQKYHAVKAGDGVSYNMTWKAKKDSIIAVIPIGYADGYHRALSNKGEALFRGQRVPVVGNVCMDFVMLDVTLAVQNETFESLKPESVTLFGWDEALNELSVVEVAQRAGTISWEVLTSVGERVPRVVDGKSYANMKQRSQEVRP